MLSSARRILTKQLKTGKVINRSFAAGQDNFMNASNSVYSEQMYEQWKEDRGSVHPSWNAYFTNMTNGLDSSSSFTMPPTSGKTFSTSSSGGASGDSNESMRTMRLTQMVYQYRKRLHEIADVNPFENEYHLVKSDQNHNFKTVLENPEVYGFTKDELDIPIQYDSKQVGFSHALKKDTWTVREVHERLMETYAGKISFEYTYRRDEDIRNWFKSKIEQYPQFTLSKEEKLELFNRVAESHAFTEFCKKKYSSSKRFGIDGCDAAISGLEKLVDHSKTLGVNNIVMGMAHRGRLNTLACVFNKPYEQLFTEFSDPGVESQKKLANADWGFSGDVKYHLGASHQRFYPDGSKMSLSMLPNPSHLETVNPVVLGKARAKQRNLKDFEGKQVLPILVHGDASLAG